jgi:LemA protein
LISDDSIFWIFGRFEGVAAFAVIVIAVIWFVVAYNTLTAASQRTARAWGNVDALLRQRHDELMRFTEACQPLLPDGQAVLDRVLAARGKVFEARHARDTAALCPAEHELRTGLADLATLVERNSRLANDDAFAALRKRLALLDAELTERRAIFNDAVQQNNRAVGRFPGNVIALLGGFRAVPPFDVEPRQG